MAAADVARGISGDDPTFAELDVPSDRIDSPRTLSAVSTPSEAVIRHAERFAYPTSSLELEDHHIDDVRSLRVTVIGAGLSGILAGILLPAKVPKIQLTILGKKTTTLYGGTWLENVYPGVRCDIPAHVYQSTFSPRTQWSQQFAEGHEILDYWQEQARKYDVYSKVKFQREVVDVSWDSSEYVWRVKTTNVLSGESFEEISDFVLTATGRFNSWKLPDYPGIEVFKGVLRHTSRWDPNFDPKDKRVAVIGNGASGIQVVPNLQRVAKRVDHYARNKTWIAAAWAGDVRTFEAQPYSPEQLREFNDPEKYLHYRKAMEEKYWRRFPALFKGSDLNEGMRSTFIDIMKQRTRKKPDLHSRQQGRETLFLSKPEKVQRTDGRKVELAILQNPWHEIRATTKLFFTKKWLFVVLFIGQAVYSEAVFFTFLSLWFSVRARALGSFLSGIVAVIAGNILGNYLYRSKTSLRTRTRSAFTILATLQGAWWLWATILVTRFRVIQPTYDWVSPGFGHAFAPYILLTIGFQTNYLFLYFIISNLADDSQDVVRYAALLRGTESAWQAVSYGLDSITAFAQVGGVYLNFGLWALSLFPAWLVIRHFGNSDSTESSDTSSEQSMGQGNVFSEEDANFEAK